MKSQRFWRSYLAASGISDVEYLSPVIDEFGDSPELANELVRLILNHTKTASCALLYEYEKESAALPVLGQAKLVVDGDHNPACVIETTEVVIKPYYQVDPGFSYDEGEGDRSYEYWDREHRKYFRRLLRREGMQFEENMKLVCERFKVIYSEIT